MEADEDEDGKISFEEFVKLVGNTVRIGFASQIAWAYFEIRILPRT